MCFFYFNIKSKSSQWHVNKNTKCPIDAHCHHNCREDPRITGLHWCQNPAEAGLVPLMNFDDLSIPLGLKPEQDALAERGGGAGGYYYIAPPPLSGGV